MIFATAIQSGLPQFREEVTSKAAHGRPASSLPSVVMRYRLTTGNIIASAAQRAGTLLGTQNLGLGVLAPTRAQLM
jgi:hypothetical protein